VDKHSVEQKLEAAVQCLLDRDSYLLEVDANERSITHRLAVYLQQKFEDRNVDCEYNRQLENTKKLFPRDLSAPQHLDDPAFDEDARTAYPDIIVHRRGTDKNLLVIEVKKTSSCVDESYDLCKLQLYKEQLGYKYALFLRLSVGTDRDEPYLYWI